MAIPLVESAGIDLKFDSANFESLDRANAHNEGKVEVLCDKSDIFNDTVSLSSYTVGNNLFFQVEINSEVRTGLFNDGVALFAYDISNGKWKMEAMADDAEWLFCDPKAAFDLILHSIGCFLADPTSKVANETKDKVRSIMESLLNDADYVVAGARLYSQRGDCDRADPSLGDKVYQKLVEYGIQSNYSCSESWGLACGGVSY